MKRLIDAEQPEQKLWKERYEDLLEYMHGEDVILKDRKEFKAWLERCRWHVRECDKLARQLEAQSKQHWRPCSERLPEERGFYLTTTKNKEVYCDFWNEDNFDRTEMVIAWMPLPKPYKGETK